MRPTLLLAFLLCLLPSCRTQKTATTSDSSVAIHDTIISEADTVTHTEAAMEATTTEATIEGSSFIEFVDGGGTVSVGHDGSLTLEGVKTIRGSHKEALHQNDESASLTSDAATHHEQLTTEHREEAQTQTTQKAPATPWYQVLLGLFVILGVIIFLLLKFKKR